MQVVVVVVTGLVSSLHLEQVEMVAEVLLHCQELQERQILAVVAVVVWVVALLLVQVVLES
jgi:hypothetical protein